MSTGFDQSLLLFIRVVCTPLRGKANEITKKGKKGKAERKEASSRTRSVVEEL